MRLGKITFKEVKENFMILAVKENVSFLYPTVIEMVISILDVDFDTIFSRH